jgi:hypothetical protein
MPSIITATQLRSVLGVSSSLYNDAYLDQIIDTAEAVILPMLEKYASPIGSTKLLDNKAIFTTVGENLFSAGQSVVITGCGSPYNGTRTILDDDNLGEYSFAVAITNADINEANVIPSGLATLSGASTYVGNDAIESAVYVVSVEVFQSRTAAGGQIEGVDFAPTPYRMGRSLVNRVQALLAPFIDVESLCQ